MTATQAAKTDVDQLADRIDTLATEDCVVHLCQANAAETEAYLDGAPQIDMWPIRARRHAEAGELLLGVSETTGRILDICTVSSVERINGWWQADWHDDIRLYDILTLADVLRAAGMRRRVAWPLEDERARAYLTALAAAIRTHGAFADVDGTRAASSCRRRSADLRDRCLNRDAGRCQSCGDDHAALLPDRRLWAALDAHHIVPLAVRQSEPDGSMITNVDELITLCATCHRLVHASADLSWTRLAEDWAKVGREPPHGRLAQKR